MDLDNIIKEAVAKTIVRVNTEKLWEKKGRLYNTNFSLVADHPYVESLDVMTRGRLRGYYEALVDASIDVEKLLASERPKQMFRNIFDERPKKMVLLKSMPYGVHMYLYWKDLKKTWTKYHSEDRGLGKGHRQAYKYEDVWISVGTRAAPTFEQNLKLFRKTRRKEKKRLGLIAQECNCTPEQLINIIERGISTKENDKAFIQEDPEAQMIMHMLKEGYRVSMMMQEETAWHELEHCHSAIIMGDTWSELAALDEIIAYSNHLGIELTTENWRKEEMAESAKEADDDFEIDEEEPEEPPKNEHKEHFRELYEERMGEDVFEDFYELNEKVHSKEIIGLDTYLKRRAFQMALLEIRDFGFVRDNFSEIVERVSNIEGELT